MMTKLMLALMVSASIMFGGAGVVAAAGSTASGDCDQTQDQTRLQLKDGSCNQVQTQTQTQDQTMLQLRDGSCAGSQCQQHLYEWSYYWNYNYGNYWR